MRDYDPTTGRYLQPDPLGLIDGASVYGYVRQSPMMFTDPTGEAIPIFVWFVAALLLERIADAVEFYCECEPSGNDVLAITTAASMADGFGLGAGKQPALGSPPGSSYQSKRLSALGIKSSVRIPTPSGVGRKPFWKGTTNAGRAVGRWLPYLSSGYSGYNAWRVVRCVWSWSW